MAPVHSEPLDVVYEALAAAIDAAGPEHEALFLARLALLLANELGDASRVRAAIVAAREDLPPSTAPLP